MDTRGYIKGAEGDEGCVRSKPDCSSQSQKDFFEPITAW